MSHIYCLSECPSGQNVQHPGRQIHHKLGQHLTDGLGSKRYSKCGNVRPAPHHQWGPPGPNFRANTL